MTIVWVCRMSCGSVVVSGGVSGASEREVQNERHDGLCCSCIR